MINSQGQKGGDGSTNIQAQQMVVNLGIDEKRAREIYHEMNLQLRSEYSQEALSLANSRVVEFENRLMPKIAQVEGALEAFADPSFQLLLVEAQKTAASTERPVDYDLLSELLIHRFQKGENRIARAAISLAVEIVDKVSDEALIGLTVTHAVGSFLPQSGSIDEGLDVLNDVFGKIFYNTLPSGKGWIDHLDILNAVRLSPMGGLKKISQFYPEVLHGYVDAGIGKNSEELAKAFEILKENNIPNSIFVEHVLNRDFVRLPIVNTNGIDGLSLFRHHNFGGVLVQVPEVLSEAQKRAISSIYELYSKDSKMKQNNIISFISEWDRRPNLKILRKWWDEIPIGFDITSVGKVIAHSNAQRCDKNLPPLD